MNIEKKFNSVTKNEYEKISCTKEEFLKIVENKEYKIVRIERNSESEFLFKDAKPWDSSTRYVIGNTAMWSECRYEEKLIGNDWDYDLLEIVK